VDNFIQKPKIISIEELPEYSDWPKRLLSLESFNIKYKTEKEVLREYQEEKWGSLLKKIEGLNNFNLDDIEHLDEDLNKVVPCYNKSEFYLAEGKYIYDQHLMLYENILGPYVESASCLVELGAGYGSKLFRLSEKDLFSDMPLFAGEYTKAGRNIISRVSKELGKKVEVGYCDFRNLILDGLDIPENAVIFTSYSLHYVPKISNYFIDFLLELKPKIVVHFEPCYEYFTEKSLHEMMCKRYIELNDYNKNIVSILEAGKKSKKITVKTKRNVIGSNPFLPISVLEWGSTSKNN